MGKNAADKMPPKCRDRNFIALVRCQVVRSLCVPDTEMDMQTVACPVSVRLGHKSRLVAEFGRRIPNGFAHCVVIIDRHERIAMPSGELVLTGTVLLANLWDLDTHDFQKVQHAMKE